MELLMSSLFHYQKQHTNSCRRVHVNHHLQIEFTKYYLVQNLFNNTCLLHVFLLNHVLHF